MFLPELSSFVAAMLFAVHPIHTEAVSYLDFIKFRRRLIVMFETAVLYFEMNFHQVICFHESSSIILI